MNILVFTGGGLAPALNPTLFGVIREAKRQKTTILGGIEGWKSLLPGGKIVDLTTLDPAPLATMAGTFLRSSRTNPFAHEDGRTQIERALNNHAIDAIIAIGGDDTLGAAQRAATEWGLPVVGVPKTIDNDLDGTYWTPGYPTAAQYVAQIASDIRTHAAYALSRIFLIEVLGGNAGWTAAAAALGGADVVLVPEAPPTIDHLLETIERRYEKNGKYAVVVFPNQINLGQAVRSFSDHQIDEYGVKRRQLVSVGLAEVIHEQLGHDVKMVVPGNLIQSVAPIQKDYETAHELGRIACEQVIKKQWGLGMIITGPDLSVSAVPLKDLVGRYRGLPPEYYDVEQLRPTAAFFDYLTPADITVACDENYTALAAARGIIPSGARPPAQSDQEVSAPPESA